MKQYLNPKSKRKEIRFVSVINLNRMKSNKLKFYTLNGVLLLALVVGFSSCKNKKKMSDVSDPNAVGQQIEEELEETEEETPEERVAVKEPTKSERLENYFQAIAQASSTTSANGSISEALTMFSNPNAPVLIVIYRGSGNPDYDEPTTIKKYLEYHKIEDKKR